ncbi:MAG: NAD(P)-dependent oxidoreductase [Brooklawnia sp.]|nr:NAD(P)-dependent oxidoreductase [Brooklawnia sp.]
MAKVAFIGLGTMGSGMSGNLLAAGHEVTVFNRTPERADRLADQGAAVESNLAEAVKGAEFVMYCLSDDAAVAEVALGPDGVMANADPTAIVIDLSTISPAMSAREHAAAQERGIRFLDAPVFGSKAESESGRLWVVVGGRREDYEAAMPVLEAISQTTHYMGPATSGCKMKLVGNLCVAAQMQSLGDALTLAAKSGLDPSDVVDVLDVTDFRTPIYSGVGRDVIRGDYSRSFALDLLLKDLWLIEDFSHSVGVDLPVLDTTMRLAQFGVNRGMGDLNASSIIKVISASAGVDLTRGQPDAE